MPNEDNQSQEEPKPVTQPVFGAPAQFSPNSVEPLGVKKEKKSKKKLFTILSAAGMFVLVAGGTITYLLLSNRTSEPTAQSNTTSLPTFGDGLKSSLEDPTNASALVYKSNNPAAVVQKVNGNVWISADDDSDVLSFNSARDNLVSSESDYKRVIERIKSEGLSEVQTLSSASADQDSSKAAVRYFSSDKLVCVLRNTSAADVYSLQVDCADQASFDKNKTDIKPLAAAYVGSKENADKDVQFTKPDIQDSVTQNYKTARVYAYELGYFGDSVISTFYQTPGGEWKFFMSAKEQDKINCDDYDNSDIVNAYLGFTCWDASANASSFVQQDSPVFEIKEGASGG